MQKSSDRIQNTEVRRPLSVNRYPYLNCLNSLTVNRIRTRVTEILFSVFCALFSVLCILYSDAFSQPPSPYAVEKLSGQKAPNFTLKDINGNSVSLSSFKGKVILLNFWATWCPPCRAEIPSMNKLNDILKKKGLVILAVSTDRAVVDVKDFLKKTPVNFTVLVDYNLNVSRSLYKVFMMPTTFLIDKRGVIVEKYFGEQDWTDPEIIKEIEALL